MACHFKHPWRSYQRNGIYLCAEIGMAFLVDVLDAFELTVTGRKFVDEKTGLRVLIKVDEFDYTSQDNGVSVDGSVGSLCLFSKSIEHPFDVRGFGGEHSFVYSELRWRQWIMQSACLPVERRLQQFVLAQLTAIQ